MQRLISLFLSITILFFTFPVKAAPSEDVSLGIADKTLGRISPLQKGQKAPFNGVLLDASAAAKLMVDQQEAENTCQIEVNKQVALTKAKLELDLANLRASNKALKNELDVRISLKDEHINFLEKEAIRNAKKANNGKWWLIGGVAGGILLSIGAALIIREITPEQPVVYNEL